ncbi:alpha/beta fold hydrolase [Geodermatophilus sp. SYSU D00691]
MTEFQRGRVSANGLTFEYLEMGEGPLALCTHGFPDTPFSYRHLLPALAEAGFHAVAPFMRGFAPTELPQLREYVHSSVLVADYVELGRALGGGPDALLVGHDWGALAGWGALAHAPDVWGRAVVMNIPPFEILAENAGTYAQIKRSFHFWYFQMERVVEDRIRQDDWAWIRDTWADWSPGLESTEDVGHVRDALSDPDHLRTVLGCYWAFTPPARFGTPEWAAQQIAAWGSRVPQPVLYLHGTNDGCHGMTQEKVDRVPEYCGEGSEAELIEGVGHFLMLERPEYVNGRIARWLERSSPRQLVGAP